MSLKELRAASDYERKLEDAFKLAQVKAKIPVPQQELQSLISEPKQLQKNIAKNNLESITPSLGPSLIKQIIEYVDAEDGDLIDLNKYFSALKLAIRGIRINSLDDFKNIYTAFKSQQIGKQLQVSPEITLVSPESLDLLERASNEELDKLFRAAVLKKEGKPVEEVDKIQYVLNDGTLSTAYKLTNKDGIIGFDPIPKINTIKGNLDKINYAKIRYIYKANNPSVSMRGLSMRWKGATTSSGSGLLRSSNPSGLGLSLKKKYHSGNIRQRLAGNYLR